MTISGMVSQLETGLECSEFFIGWIHLIAICHLGNTDGISNCFAPREKEWIVRVVFSDFICTCDLVS